MSDSDSGSSDTSIAQEGHGHVQLNRTGKPLTHKQKQNLKRKAKREQKYEQGKKIKIQQPPAPSSSEDEDREDELEGDEESGSELNIPQKTVQKGLAPSSRLREHVEADGDNDSDSESETLPTTTKRTKPAHQVEVETDSQSEEDDEQDAERDDGEDEDGEDEQKDEDESVSEDEHEDEHDEEEKLGGDTEYDAQHISTDAVDQGYAELRKELSNMPFDELQQLKEKIGIKLYNQVMFGQEAHSNQKRFKRENKNRPMEVSSKRKPRRLREVLQVKKQMVRDPRFDDLSGEYKEDIFKSTYSFLTDVKKNEKQKLLKKLTKEKDAGKKEQLEYLVHRMTAQEKADRNKEQQKQRDRQRKKQERVLVSEGKQPFYLKQSDKKKLELAEKFRELKKAGKVDTYLTKKRKKNAQKERRNLPTQQQ